MMKIADFIGEQPDFMTPDECAEIIAHYESVHKLGVTFTRRQTNDMEAHHKSDTSFFPMENLNIFPGSFITRTFINKFWPAYGSYVEKFSTANEGESAGISGIRLQKTEPQQGYHVWHHERTGPRLSRRILGWMVYLNDVAEGGETEFLYLSRRITPKAGTLLIWPAGFTHTHRGNPPLTGDKYILTGWLEFV